MVDDSDRSNATLCRGVPGVRYLRLTRPTPLGTKLNLGIAEARGDVVQKLDDDDYYAPEFLAQQAERLPLEGRDGTIVTRCCFLVAMAGREGVWHSGHGWRPGGAFCFHRELWRRQAFRDTAWSEDTQLLRDLNPRVERICDAEKYVVMRHGANTWRKVAARDGKVTVEEFFGRGRRYEKGLAELMPEEAARFYRRVLRW